MFGTMFHFQEPTINTSKVYMLSQTLYKEVSRISKDLKDTHKNLKKNRVRTSDIIQSGQIKTKENDNNKCYKHYETMMIS